MMTLFKHPVTSTVFLVLLIFAAQPPTQMAQAREGDPAAALKPFIGMWKGVCADGKEFVVLTINLDGSDIAGTLSLANMEGHDGQCKAVVDPPSKDHSMKIRDAQLKGKALAFKGSQNADFEMTVVDSRSARLKFLDTPIEDNPWQLTRAD